MFFKAIIIYDMDRYKQKEMKKERPSKRTWFHWVINYFLLPIRKTAEGKVLSLFKTNTFENYGYQTVGSEKKLSKLKIQKQSEEGNAINNIRNHFSLKKENETTKNRIIRDISYFLNEKTIIINQYELKQQLYRISK